MTASPPPPLDPKFTKIVEDLEAGRVKAPEPLWNGKETPTGVPPEEQDSSDQSPSKGTAVCGNDLCEPGYGETKETCADDCTGED